MPTLKVERETRQNIKGSKHFLALPKKKKNVYTHTGELAKNSRDVNIP